MSVSTVTSAFCAMLSIASVMEIAFTAFAVTPGTATARIGAIFNALRRIPGLFVLWDKNNNALVFMHKGVGKDPSMTSTNVSLRVWRNVSDTKYVPRAPFRCVTKVCLRFYFRLTQFFYI